MARERFKFDPRDLIVRPFIKCPQCGETAFGILNVGHELFKRRCRECRLTRDFFLPEVHKTILYLDQFVITNLMHIHAKGEKKPQPFFHDIYKKLTRLSTLQAIVCPASTAHRFESMVSTKRQELTDGFKMLAHNVRFADFDDIRHTQVFDRLDKWLKGNASDECNLRREDVLEGDNPDVWHKLYQISVDAPPTGERVDSIRSYLEKCHDGLVDVFQNTWKKEPERTWEYWRDREAAAWGPGVFQNCVRETQRLEDIHSGRREPTSLYDFQPHGTVILLNKIAFRIAEAGHPKETLFPLTKAFMHSESLARVPFLQIAGSLFACLAKKAQAQVKLPTQGFYSDVDVMSCLLPYCDAMFVDRECCAYWREIQRTPKRRMPYESRVFSLAHKEEFLSYLDELEAAVPPLQRQLAGEIYGLGKE